MNSRFLAHIAEDGRTQTVSEHLHGTAELAMGYAAEFDAAEQGYLAGLVHDIGKYSEAFQRRLQGGEIVDHATAGAQVCQKLGQPFAAFCAAGHHTGLLDMGSKVDREDAGTMRGRLKKQVEDYSAFSKEINLPDASFPAYCGKDSLTDSFFIRMLFSAMKDADCIDTENFERGEKRPENPPLEELHKMFREYISGWFPGNNALNRQRCKILSACISAGEKLLAGIYTLTVPTGGGKTAASMGFALEQAKVLGKKRIIYVIPYTSIIEQTADFYRGIFGSENVLEHHANVQCVLPGESLEAAERRAKKAENWDAPIIVTTAVQFFESLFSNKTSKCRKLHNIANSVIIFDEAQMMPTGYLYPCVYAITELVKNYHATAVLCTATQPALDRIVEQFWPNQQIEEICPPELINCDVFTRTVIRGPVPMSWDAVCGEMNAKRQVLCIVNTRRNAGMVYSRLEGEGCFHLSTRMCAQHRRAILKEIRERLKKGEVCRVVSTSLIEAGVDVDFPAVFREEAGLDSVIQAAGRCNREGRRTPENSIVTVFRAEEKIPPMFRIPIGAAREATAHHEEMDTPEAIACYFSSLYDLKGDALDKKNILNQLGSGRFPFETVAAEFHLIEEDTQTVLIPWKEGESLIARFRNGDRSRQMYRRLSGYGVNLYTQQFDALYRAGDLEMLEENLYMLKTPELYTEETGLRLDTDAGKPLFI